MITASMCLLCIGVYTFLFVYLLLIYGELPALLSFGLVIVIFYGLVFLQG